MFNFDKEKVFALRTISGYHCVLVVNENEFELIVHSGWDDKNKQDLYWAHDANGTPQLGCSLFCHKSNQLVDIFLVELSDDARVEVERLMPCTLPQQEKQNLNNVIPLFGKKK